MKIFRLLITVAHFVLIALLLGTIANAYVTPKVFPLFNLLSLAFPVLMMLNVALILFWMLLRKKRALIFLAVSLLLIMPVRRWINYSGESAETPNLKIVTVNIKGGTLGIDKIQDYLKNSGADIILNQEVSQQMKIPGYQYHTTDFPLVCLNSKTEILKQEHLESEGVGNAFFADIRCNGRIIRLINVYLTPFSFDKGKVKPTEDFDQNKTTVKYILKRLIPGFKIHQEEVLVIQKAIADSPYPVIVAGDFNSVPNSYEYYQIGKNLKDVFVETGNGSATSFHDYKFPIRIDYVFCSKELKPVSYSVDRNVKISDHYPVIAEFKIE
ncbi:endonuclease/exonuclease/phosphatase family protein [Chryseobacterium sp.]|uniref:endonuclease/exonuclease/phosphatase family protein n=1 Tax=Chryseobacterium sp. TaxID=1871047 RepID=UPI0011C8E966|nr:endonuclease/exonuclease/phosphatase family protein [Chryseobacterium sp.]TXF75986.1 AP endonuclease [Chryseobacterium sp.]